MSAAFSTATGADVRVRFCPSPTGDGAIEPGQVVEIGIGGIGTLGNTTRLRP